MVKQEPVNVNWQSLFVIIPFVELWAAYRVEKLRLYLIMIMVPSLFVYYFVRSLIYVEYFEKFIDISKCEPNLALYFFFNSCDQIEMQVFDIVFTVLFIGLAVFLIRKWSRKWNDNFSKINSGDGHDLFSRDDV